MKPYRIAREDDDHFLIDHGDGKPYPVAKKLLRPEHQERVRNMAKGGKVEPGGTDIIGAPPPLEETPLPYEGTEREPLPLQKLGETLFGKETPEPYNPQASLATPAAPPEPPAGTTPAPAAAPVGSAPMPGTPGAGGGGSELRAIEAARQYEEGGLQAAAQTAADKAAAETAERERQQQELDRFELDWNGKEAGWNAELQARKRERLDMKVDPDAFWKNSSGNTDIAKVAGSAISILLGGVGAGLTGGPNVALAIVQKAIDRNIDAQVQNIRGKDNQIAQLMREGFDLRQARQVEEARKWRQFGLHLDTIAAQYKGPEAAANAAIGKGQAEQRYAQLMSTVKSQKLQNALTGIQIQQGQMQLGMGRLQMGAMSQFLGAQTGAGGPTAAGGEGADLDPRIIPLLPKEMSEKIVQLPNGKYAMAPDKEEANKTREAFVYNDVLKNKLGRYVALMHADPSGLWNPLSAKWGEAEAIRGSMITDLNHLSNLNRLNEREVEIFKDRITNLHGFVGPAGRAKVAELGKEIDDKVWANQRSMLLLKQRKRPGG